MARKDISDLQVVQACHDMVLGAGAAAAEILEARTGQHYKVCIRAMERAEDRGLIEYGTTIRRSWLTPQGEAFLAASNACAMEPCAECGGLYDCDADPPCV